MADRRRRGQHRLVERLTRQLRTDTGEIGADRLPLAIDDVALRTRARTGKHGLAVGRIARALDELRHRRELLAPLGLRHRQHIGSRLPNVAPRARRNRHCRHLRQDAREFTSLRHRDKVFRALLRPGQPANRRSLQFRRRLGIGDDALEQCGRPPRSADAEGAQQAAGCGWILAAQHALHVVLPAAINRLAGCSRRQLLACALGGSQRHKLALPVLESEPLHDVDELLRARHIAERLGDPLGEGRIGGVGHPETYRKFRQDNPHLFVGHRGQSGLRRKQFANGFVHAGLVLEVECPDERQRLWRRDLRIHNTHALHRCRLAAAASPDDLTPDRILRTRGLRQPGLETAVPQTVSADAEGFEFPAVTGLVLRGKRSPRPIGSLAGKALQCNRTLATNGDGRIGLEFLHEAKHIALREPAHPQGNDPEGFVFVGRQPFDPGLGQARQHARRPGEPRLEPRIRGRFECFSERSGGILRLLRQVLKRYRAGAQVRARQRRHAARDRAKVGCRHAPLRFLGRNPIETPLLGIAHPVATHAWIVPVGHDQRPVRCHADVAGPKPPVG